VLGVIGYLASGGGSARRAGQSVADRPGQLMFLMFPTRMAQATPGDLSQAGRHMLTMMAKMLALGVGLGIPAILGAIAHAVTDSWVAVAVVVLAGDGRTGAGSDSAGGTRIVTSTYPATRTVIINNNPFEERHSDSYDSTRFRSRRCPAPKLRVADCEFNAPASSA